MERVPQKTTAPQGWRFPLAVGLAIGLALPVSRSVGTNLEPSFGFWGAFALSTVAAGVVGGIVAAGIFRLLRPSGNGSP
jgi:hypothetical protein